MVQIIVVYVTPAILLVIALSMALSDFFFYQKEKKQGIVATFWSWPYLVRVFKVAILLLMAWLMFDLVPRFLRAPHPGAAQPEAAALRAYHAQWDQIVLCGLIFIVAFLLDVWGRLKALQASYQQRIARFLMYNGAVLSLCPALQKLDSIDPSKLERQPQD